MLRRLLALSAALVLAACASSPKVISGAGGAGIGQTQALASTALPRIAVGNIIDKTNALDEKSIPHQLALLNAQNKSGQPMSEEGVLHGLRDMLTTALFDSGKFIVLERDNLNDAMVEQEFSQSGRVGEASKIPMGQLEGAQMLVVGAPNSSNSLRLVEVAKLNGCPRARLITRASEIDWRSLAGTRRLGLTASASAPEELVEEVIAACRDRFEVSIEEVAVTREDICFKLPRLLTA